VQSVTAGGPAAKAGLMAGDVIVSVNGQRTATVDEFTSVVSELKPGTTVTLAIDTQHGKRKTLHLKLGEFPGTS
jgi:S1-C subfamily serine protease